MGKDEPPSGMVEEERSFDDLPLGNRLRRWGILLILMLALSVLVGFGTVAVLRLAGFLQASVWSGLYQALPDPLQRMFPLVVCALGGVLVGLWGKHCGYTLDTLGTVVASCRREGGYRIRNWGQTLVLFLLPIAFGGAVGPEAGMSCFAAALATLALGAMRRAGYAVTDPATDPLRAAVRVLAPGNAEAKELRARRRWVRDALWAWCGLGFVAGALLFSHIFGKGEGMPRFAPVDYRTFDLGASVLALAIAFALFTINEAASRAIPRLVGGLGTVTRAVICGLVLGAVACFLPDVLFSGQSATGELMGDWASRGAALLAATAVVKLILTNLCESSGWVGGEFFPLIFCGVSGGYAAAALLGVDPLLPVAVCAGAFVATHTRKPLLAVCVLAICFPPLSLPAVAVGAFIGAKVARSAEGDRIASDATE